MKKSYRSEKISFAKHTNIIPDIIMKTERVSRKENKACRSPNRGKVDERK